VVSETAMSHDPQGATGGTQLLLATHTCRTFSATNPGVDDASITNLNTLGIGPNGNYFAKDFMA
jgi:hypothetical protein